MLTQILLQCSQKYFVKISHKYCCNALQWDGDVLIWHKSFVRHKNVYQFSHKYFFQILTQKTFTILTQKTFTILTQILSNSHTNTL